MNASLIGKLHSCLESKNEIYQSIAKTLVGIDDYSLLKLKDVEEACHVSATTVFRFCKFVGFSGFSELKFALVEYQKAGDAAKLVGERGGERASVLHFDNIMQSIAATQEIISAESLKKVADMIAQSTKVNIYALGSTALVAKDLEYKLDRANKVAKTYCDENLQYFSAVNSGKSTLVIGITYSGQTKCVVDNLIEAKKRGGKTVLITSMDNAQFANDFDVVIFISSNESTIRLITTTARFSMLYVVDLIYNEYLNADKENNIGILERNKLQKRGMR